MARTKKAVVNKPSPSQAAPANLDAVVTAMEEARTGDALLAALAAWRASRSPELADLVGAIGARIAWAPLRDELEWTSTALSKSPFALGRLLSTIVELPVAFLPTAIGKLAAFPDDPRIGRAAAFWIVEPPTLSSSAYPFWTGLYKLVERVGDTRVIEAIDQRLAMEPPKTLRWKGDKHPKPSQFWGKFYAALDKTRGALAALPAVPSDKRLAKLVKAAEHLPQQHGALPKTSAKPRAKAGADPQPPLARALAHATKREVPEAIAALLEAWRAKRAPELADLIDRASRLLPSSRATLPAAVKPAAAAWQAAFDRDPAGELPCLLRHLHVGGPAAVVEHLIALSSLPDDPRIALRLAELAVTHTMSPERNQYWKSSWELIARIGDVRVIPSLRQDFDDFSGTYYDHHRSGKRLLGDFLATRFTSPLDAADHKLIDQLAAALAKIVPDHLAREHALIREIVANWDDDAPRLVYADWLIERGHTAGELIVLACKAKRSQAEDKQLKLLRGSFRAPTYLFGALGDFELALDRGLPSQLKTTWNQSPISWRSLPGDPLLPCVEELTFDTHDRRGRPAPEDVARVMLDPAATRLARVTSVPNDTFNQRVDPRFEPIQPAPRLADALELLVKARWKRDDRAFTRR